jgi:Putative endonuclease segE, GIY-YIG domain
MWYITHNTRLDFESMAIPFDTEKHNLEDYYGFVYVIIEKSTNKKYIGKKFFWSSKILPVTKTRKRRQKTLVESDWMQYYGSSVEVKSLVEQNGVDNYKRIILRLCKTKGECSYYEAKYQFDNDVLLSDDFYNEFIGCKIHSKHLKGLK